MHLGVRPNVPHGVFTGCAGICLGGGGNTPKMREIQEQEKGPNMEKGPNIPLEDLFSSR